MAFHPARRPADLADAAPATDSNATAKASGAGAHAVLTDPDAVAVRSALSATPSLRLRLDDTDVDLVESHAVLPDGTVVLAVDPMTRTGGLLVAARGRPGAVRLDVTQLVPVAVRSRVRARVRMLGTAHRFDPASLDSCDTDTVMSLLDLPPVALWAVEPIAIGLARDIGGTTVDISAYRAARPDPLAADEAAHLQHLAQRHSGVLNQLATLVDPALMARSARVIPVAVDADGIVLRAETPDTHTDVRLPFARRVVTNAGLAEALRTLLAEVARRRSHHPPTAGGERPSAA
ncbi:DUF2470 domain-containing protein [Micromonospora sp. WMMA1363]|uniref:DUF2470 domain-containing protein n=1 Tax=Micromonospora sp. WMMA1363 TaxID=3053985 RepID=UPI00259CAFED|nr:DUF2470 domain-containing protein [Micromonospora sp. WMMA1363]MDM4719562.1 DUF2470 domain-containing protein [Micromonospora sp. WMMA1363]